MSETEANWDLARRVANRVARVRANDKTVDLPAGVRVEEVAGRVSAYIGIDTPTDLPILETLSRSEWITAFLERERCILAARQSLAQRQARWWERGPITRWLRSCWQGVKLGIQGGRKAKSIAGEYLWYPRPLTLAPRLLLVAPNVARKANRLESEREALVSWITIHEVTHALQFVGFPWLKPYSEDLEERAWQLEAQPGSSRRDHRAIEHKVEMLIEVIEGHANHVTDVVAQEMGSPPCFGRAPMPLRPRLEMLWLKVLIRLHPRYRGSDAKVVVHPPLRPGFNLCQLATESHVLDKLFQSPETLPNAGELADPERWLARVQQ
jgi:uncharacterized protein (DUF2342 family)